MQCFGGIINLNMMFVKKNIFYFLSILFLLVGISFTVVSAFNFLNTLNLLSNSHKTLGKIVGINEERQSKGGYMYSPLIKYKSGTGDEYVYSSATKTGYSSYKIGQEVELIYDKNNPQNARINSILDIWFLTILMGVLGSVITITGVILLSTTLKKRRQTEYLKKNGQKILADFTNIGRGLVEINGENGYVINCQWVNPQDNVIYTFKSDDIWFDPTNCVKDKKINVLIDLKNPKKYYVDLSFLPNS